MIYIFKIPYYRYHDTQYIYFKVPGDPTVIKENKEISYSLNFQSKN